MFNNSLRLFITRCVRISFSQIMIVIDGEIINAAGESSNNGKRPLPARLTLETFRTAFRQNSMTRIVCYVS